MALPPSCGSIRNFLEVLEFDCKMRNVLRVLQWNAGNLTQKRSQLLTTLIKEDVNVFSIVEADLISESLKFHNFPGYSYVLPKSRKVPSGIFVGIKQFLKCSLKLVT